MEASKPHSELREAVEHVRQGVAFPDQPWHEFTTFAESLDVAIGPNFGKDAACVARYAKSLEEQFDAVRQYVESWVPFDFLPDRPQEFAQVWYEREGKLRELVSNPAMRPVE